MIPRYSLTKLRDEIKTELRVISNDNSRTRYTDAEINLAIRRAVSELESYFWFENTDESKTYSTNTHEYEYEYPISDIFEVTFEDSPAPLRFASDWMIEPNLDGGSTLRFLKDHNASDVIRVRYEHHPHPYPTAITLNGAFVPTATVTAGTFATIAGTETAGGLDSDDTGLFATEDDAVDFPPPPFWIQIDNEVMKVTSWDPNNVRMIIERGALGTRAATHSQNATIDFVNLAAKPVFFEGIKEWAMGGLHRSRVIDATNSEVQANVTIMRSIDDMKDRWLRRHRMRSRVPMLRDIQRTKSLRRGR